MLCSLYLQWMAPPPTSPWIFLSPSFILPLSYIHSISKSHLFYAQSIQFVVSFYVYPNYHSVSSGLLGLSPSSIPSFPSCPFLFYSPTEAGMIFFWHKYNQAINVMPSFCCEHFNVFLWLLDKNQNFKYGWQDLTWSGPCHVSHLIP